MARGIWVNKESNPKPKPTAASMGSNSAIFDQFGLILNLAFDARTKNYSWNSS